MWEDRKEKYNKQRRERYKKDLQYKNKRLKETKNWMDNNIEKHLAQRKEYRTRPEVKIHQARKNKEWREKNKKYISKKNKEYRLENNDKLNEYNRKYNKEHYAEIKKKRKPYFIDYQSKEENKAKARKRKNIYDKTEKGKINMAKTKSKRKRNLGFNILFENEIDEPISWHHVNDNDVVAVPEDIHVSFLFGSDSESHREMLFSIVVQLYPEFGSNV